MSQPSNHQLERFIRESAADSFNVFFTKHALQRMKQRKITQMMALEALRMGCMKRQPEPDIKHMGLKCRMERLVAGVSVAVEVCIEHPSPDLTVVTVINLGE